MRRELGRTRRTASFILGMSACLVALACGSAYAEKPTPTKPAGETVQADEARQAEKRFKDFKQKLADRIDKRILTIVGWVPVEAGDPFGAVVLSVRKPLEESLEKTKTEFLAGLDKKKSEIQKALIDVKSIETQAEKYFKDVDEKLLEHFRDSRRTLADLIKPRPLSLGLTIAIGLIFAGAFGFLIWAIYNFIIKKAYQKEGEPLQPARLVKGTVRSVIAMAITYLIVLLALTDFLIHQRIGAYLTAAFTAVIAFYFGSRAIEAFYARKAGFSYSKTSADGSKEKIEGYETPEAVQKLAEMTSAIQDVVVSTGRAVEEFKRREEQGLGYVRGAVAFDPDVDDKSGVTVILVEQPEITATTVANGSYLLKNVPPGTYVLKAEKEGYAAGSTEIPLEPRGDVEADIDITLSTEEAPQEGHGGA